MKSGLGGLGAQKRPWANSWEKGGKATLPEKRCPGVGAARRWSCFWAVLWAGTVYLDGTRYYVGIRDSLDLPNCTDY